MRKEKKIMLIANKALTYDNVMYQAGEYFQAADNFGRVLLVTGLAREGEVAAPKRRYRRRDMQPETTE